MENTTTIEIAIENLYKVFSKYSTSNMFYCKCGCIDEEDVKKLASKKLRELKEDDFSSYHGSALYTWGDINHYKHFLPRILEVHNLKNGDGFVGLYEITSKLTYAEWNTWPPVEVKAIKDFMLLDWQCFIGNANTEIKKDDLEYYSFFHPLQDLFKLWDVTKNEKTLKSFVHFFYYCGTELLNKGLKLNEKTYTTEFEKLILQKGLLKALEKEFFQVAELEKEYSEKVSIVIQMIEQQIR